MLDLKIRTQRFAIACGRLCASLPKDRLYDAYCRQLIRSSASVGANYRAALRGKSDRDFINKLKIVEEEADESEYWIELLEAVGEIKNEKFAVLRQESHELTAITVASIKKARERLRRNGKK